MNQEEIKALIKEHLENGKISKIYRNTYYSLLDRVEPNGCYPESVRPGGYGAVMFCRTTGGIDALLRETEEYAVSEKIIRFALESSRRMGLRRVPHIAHQITYDETVRFSKASVWMIKQMRPSMSLAHGQSLS